MIMKSSFWRFLESMEFISFCLILLFLFLFFISPNFLPLSSRSSLPAHIILSHYQCSWHPWSSRQAVMTPYLFPPSTSFRQTIIGQKELWCSRSITFIQIAALAAAPSFEHEKKEWFI